MILILILILVTLCGRVSTTRDLLLSLSVPNSAVSINELLVTSIVTNTGDHSLRLLNDPRTVLSHLPTRVFHISRGNITPDFTGLIVHYSPDYVVQKNNSDDFTFLDPGQTYERIHSLAGVYNFTGTGPGEYQIESYDSFYHVDNSGKIVIVKAETNSTRFKISGGLVQSRKTAPNRFNSFAQSTQMLQSGCTIDQQNVISEAATYADQYISNALTYLQSINGYTPRHGAWFGAYGPQLVETVKFHYANMVGRAMVTAYDCMPDSCRDGAVAYVWPQHNSKAGTIIHELSHFTGTVDHVYGEVGSLDLARSSPSLAIGNADSHMYFAENSAMLP
ncbi:hypothetical protein AG1IA_07291 [Rhizoctonia solani AG-1 IA]|uniref:Lysine-specific metallo-endopeptidase domain-containing protein n=1 Tax=Thanatephorus cucumeris (strain AG1-IA) TaxID=983506 RepID=L8WL74_THACA|nr:hypothetical protein AG1IA_07291 [Rhizoctonia solani AG-1 IA]